MMLCFFASASSSLRRSYTENQKHTHKCGYTEWENKPLSFIELPLRSTLSLLLQPLRLHLPINLPLFTSPFSVFTLVSAHRYSLGCSATLYPIPGAFSFSTVSRLVLRCASVMNWSCRAESSTWTSRFGLWWRESTASDAPWARRSQPMRSRIGACGVGALCIGA